MNYQDLLLKLYRAGFTRVERDDRLLDVFPDETQEWGVELWEKWNKADVHILRVRLPYDSGELLLYAIDRQELEALLYANQESALKKFPVIPSPNHAFF